MTEGEQSFQLAVQALLEIVHSVSKAHEAEVSDAHLSVLKNVTDILYSLEQELDHERDD